MAMPGRKLPHSRRHEIIANQSQGNLDTIAATHNFIWFKGFMALVLCTGIDPAVMKTRQLILEHAGHTVILASDDRQVEKACKSHRFDIVVIGQNTSPALKQRYFQAVREHCKEAKILELHRPFSERALGHADAWLAMPNDSPEELAEAVNALGRPPASARSKDQA